ncbi:hypothetical protein BVY01_02715 [bacterium I07]|nr:hypothetical protein BVY01_02715 [bacterium I07]
MAKEKYNSNLLDYIPVHAVEWEYRDDGTIFLKVPKSKNRLALKIIRLMRRSLDTNIQLDDFGSYVWKQCDGIQNVQQIGEKLKSEFGSTVEPVFDRLGTFIKILSHQKLITYQNIN